MTSCWRTTTRCGPLRTPGLAAKAVIDVLITVADITAEEDYLDQLLAVGYELRVREPGHRLVRTKDRDVHVHVLQVGNEAADDYLLFRDRLRADAEDRDLQSGHPRFHEMSHGESFPEVLLTRFDSPGLYCLDEPEAGLSFSARIALVGTLHDVAASGGQVLCAPRTRRSWRRYLDDPVRYLRHVIGPP